MGYRWKRQYGTMDREEAKRLRDLEKENARLKKLLAEQVHDNDEPQGGAAGKTLSASHPHIVRRATKEVLRGKF